MALQMKRNCEKCKAALDLVSAAMICSYECTFCPACATELKAVCPNCSGELVARPVRRAAHAAKSPMLASATTPFSAYIDG